MKSRRAGRVGWLALVAAVAIAVSQVYIGVAGAYDQSVYNNLMKTRDALLQQRDYLQQALDDTQRKLDRLNSYLDQNSRNLRDVELALRQLPN